MAETTDALRARYHEALQRRLQGAPERVQQALRARLPTAPEEPAQPAPGAPLASTSSPPAPAAARAASRRAPPPPSPLGLLDQHIAEASGHGLALRPELRSAQAFRETWARICAEDEVEQAVQRGPENPGPLNSHTLVLRSLRLMSELSPDYLRRFMAHADTLLWLEEASPWLKPAAAAGKGKKPRLKR